MRILDLEKLFQQDDTLDQALQECAEDFEKIDYWSGLRKSNLTDNPEEITKALNELSGCYSNLRTALSIAETEKRNREVRHYEQLKIDTENAEKKFVSAVAEKQANVHVASYRRIRNIILAYTEACDKHIITLQSILRDLNKDYKHPQG